MEMIYMVVILLLAIATSDLINKMVPRVPAILIQIAIGVLISFLPSFREFELDPELFMIILIKPLIFSEAQKLSIHELKENVKPILSLAFIFVVISVAVIGIFVDIMLPEVPLATTCILASIIIPTNAGILKSLSRKLKFLEAMHPILEGESLFNESIAILLYEAALAASLSAEFSLKETVYDFIVAIVGGIFAGAVLGFLIIRLRYAIALHDFEDPDMMVVIQLITPFIVYIISEQYLHVSGIIAVIVAGVMHSVEKPLLNMKSTKLQVISDNTWEVIDYMIEGFVALLLGLLIPPILTEMVQHSQKLTERLCLVGIFIYILWIALRYLWVRLQPRTFLVEGEEKHSYRKWSAIYALSGVHGTITLAVALLIPVLDNNGEAFFFRDELVFVAAIVILVSIIVPAITFPMLLKREEDIADVDMIEMQKEMLLYVIQELEDQATDQKSSAAQDVMTILRGKLRFLEKKQVIKPDRSKVVALWKRIAEIERSAIEKLEQEGTISKTAGHFYQYYIRNVQKPGLHSFLLKIRMAMLQRKLKRWKARKKDERATIAGDLDKVQEDVSNAVLHYLYAIKNNANDNAVEYVIGYYKKRLERSMLEMSPDEEAQSFRECFSRVFQMEYRFIKDYLEKGKLSTEVANQLREQISYDELIYLKK